MLAEVVRRTKVFAAPPLFVNDGPGGITLTHSNNFWYGVVCGTIASTGDDYNYALYEVTPDAYGNWQVQQSGRAGIGYELNKNLAVPLGKVVQVKPGFNGEYLFESYAQYVNSPVKCGSSSSMSSESSESSQSSQSSICNTEYAWALLSVQCVNGQYVGTWGNQCTGATTNISPYSLAQCITCGTCGSSSMASIAYNLSCAGVTLDCPWPNQLTLTVTGTCPWIPGGSYTTTIFSGGPDVAWYWTFDVGDDVNWRVQGQIFCTGYSSAEYCNGPLVLNGTSSCTGFLPVGYECDSALNQTWAGSVYPCVDCTITLASGEFVLHLKDNGPGAPGCGPCG